MGEEGQSLPDQTVSGSITGATEPVNVKISYTNHGMLFASFTLASGGTGLIRVSGDGLRLIGNGRLMGIPP